MLRILYFLLYFYYVHCFTIFDFYPKPLYGLDYRCKDGSTTSDLKKEAPIHFILGVDSFSNLPQNKTFLNNCYFLSFNQIDLTLNKNEFDLIQINNINFNDITKPNLFVDILKPYGYLYIRQEKNIENSYFKMLQRNDLHIKLGDSSLLFKKSFHRLKNIESTNHNIIVYQKRILQI